MGWLSDKFNAFRKVAEPAYPMPPCETMVPVQNKTGEQSGAMADPQGKRVYHEYFVGEDRGDGHYPWATRVYTGGVLHSEKQGLATTAAVARQQADNWGLAVKAQILGAP